VLELLLYLIANRDRLVTRQELMDTVWGDTVISESALSKAVARLRKALDDDSATHRYVDTVHSKGYRFVAEVEETELAAGKTRESPAWYRVAMGAVLVVLILLGIFWIRPIEQDASQAASFESLAVLPLSNLTGDPGQDYYVDGLQDILITELSQIPGLRVTSRQSTRRYRDSQLPMADIAAELGVDALVEGSLLREGNSIVVTIQLIDGKSDEHIWAARYAREVPDLFNLIADVTQAIGVEINAALVPPGGGEQVATRRGQTDPRAVDAYARGLMHLDRFAAHEVQSAIDQFEKAVAIEPTFAHAWGKLAAAHAMLGLYGFAPPRESMEKARAAALQAIEADKESYLGYAGIGWARLWTGDIEGGCKSFKEALRRNPLFDGRIDESIARIQELVVISPFSAMHNRPLPYHLFLARRYDEALSTVESMRARIPGLFLHYILSWVYWDQGEYDKALEAERLELERRDDILLLEALDAGLDTGGPTGAMRAMALALVERRKEAYVDPFEIGKTFARAGMVDEALYWLEEAVDYGSYETMYIAFRPDFDVLRSDPRFQDLMKRVYGPQM
jgi:TolB-like protein